MKLAFQPPNFDKLKRMLHLAKVTKKRNLLSINTLQRLSQLSNMSEPVVNSISALEITGSYVWPPETLKVTCKHCEGVLNIKEFDDKHIGIIVQKISKHAESHFKNNQTP